MTYLLTKSLSRAFFCLWYLVGICCWSSVVKFDSNVRFLLWLNNFDTFSFATRTCYRFWSHMPVFFKTVNTTICFMALNSYVTRWFFESYLTIFESSIKFWGRFSLPKWVKHTVCTLILHAIALILSNVCIWPGFVINRFKMIISDIKLSSLTKVV